MAGEGLLVVGVQFHLAFVISSVFYYMHASFQHSNLNGFRVYSEQAEAHMHILMLMTYVVVTLYVAK